MCHGTPRGFYQKITYACDCVVIEGFVVYTGGDNGLHPNVMLLVQVMGVRDV